jgi:outer membrane protein assembly factor BamA
MRGLSAILQVAVFAGAFLSERQAPAEEPQTSRPPRFEGSLEPRLPHAPLAKIVIEGNHRIQSEKILKLIKTRAGQTPDVRQIREDVRALISQRWFSDVETRVQNSEAGSVLIFTVKERPLLAKITFQGNQQFPAEELGKLAERCGVKAGNAYEVGSNRAAAQCILEHYRESGFVHAKVELEKGGHTDDREVVFKVDEGPKVAVTGITFVGNKSNDATVLKSILRTTIRDVWFSDGKYRPDVVDDDVVALRNFYQDRGFFDVTVQKQETFSDDRSEVHLKFVIDEGVPFKIRNIEITGNESIDQRKLLKGFLLRKGERYDQRAVNADKEFTLTQYANIGYVLADVVHQVRSFEEPGFVDVIYKISEGDRFPMAVAGQSGKHDEPQPGRSKGSAATQPKQKTGAADPRGLRDIDRLMFTGVESVDVANIRRALVFDFDIDLAAHPHGTLANFASVLERQLLAGYQFSGFPDAKIEVTLNSAQGQIEVQVAEGRHFDCGEIRLNGMPQPLIDDVVKTLTVNPKRRLIIWRKGESAPFDNFTANRIRRRVEAVFEAAGLFEPRFDIEMAQNPESQVADLNISVREIGHREMVGKIAVIGTNRDSPDDVSKYLELHPGMPFDSELSDRLQRRLWESGRYLKTRVDVQAAEKPSTADERPVRNLQIKLLEFKQSPPLAKKLSPVEQAVLKLREWLEQWTRGEIAEDLVVTASTGVDGTSHGPRMAARVVIAPDRGQTIVFDARGSDGKSMMNVVFVAYADRMVLAAPQRHVKIEFPNSDGRRLALEFSCTSIRTPFEDDETQPFAVNLGLNLHKRSNLKAAAFGVESNLSPVVLLSLAASEESQSEFHDGVCTVRTGNYKLQVDAASGRLLEFRFEDKTDGTVLSVRTESEALKSELEHLEPKLAALEAAYDKTSPWKSLCEFALDSWHAAADHERLLDERDSVRALRRLVGRWSPPTISDLFDDWDAPSNHEKTVFAIPTSSYGFDGFGTPGSLTRKNCVGLHLPVFRRLAPQEGWLWPVGRDAAMSWALGDKVSSECLAETSASPEIGPIGDLLLGLLDSYLTSDLRESAGIAGITHLSVDAFRNDYRALLKEDSWIGRWFVSLARALRTLDNAELSALARFLPANAPRELIVNSLRDLKANPNQSVESVLPKVLDRLWVEALRAEVSERLRHFVTEAVHRREQSRQGDPVVPASAQRAPEQR